MDRPAAGLVDALGELRGFVEIELTPEAGRFLDEVSEIFRGYRLGVGQLDRPRVLMNAVLAVFVVEVRSGRAARHADKADDLALAYRIAHAEIAIAAQVRVQRRDVVAMLDLDTV